MKLNQDQIEAIRAAVPELAEQLEAGEKVTVEREVNLWTPRDSLLYNARHAKETNATLALLAYREEFAPGYVVGEILNREAYVYQIRGFGWCVAAHEGVRVPGVVYMPRDVALSLCRKLNSGEVVL